MTSKHPTYAEVAPAVPLPASSPAVYTYRVQGAAQPSLFSRVRVPFGRRLVTGVVVGVHHKRVPYQTKVLTPLSATQLTTLQVAFARWIATTMQGGLGYTLRLFFPPGQPTAGTEQPAAPRTRRLSAQVTRVVEYLRESDVGLLNEKAMSRYTLLRQVAAVYARHDKQFLILVPEQWMVDHILKTLPANEASTWRGVHGGMRTKELTQIWYDVLRGRVRTVVGTQKALFFPFQQLGAVAIEEEFFSTHKLWDQYPRLHNIYGARALARLHGTHVLFSSSFASVELRHGIDTGAVQALSDESLLPQVVVHEKTWEDRDRRHLLPSTFVNELQMWLKSGETVLVLHNARGTWQTVLCRRCHQAVRCPDCGVAFSAHGTKKTLRLECHHCGRKQPWPSTCPLCHKGTLSAFGAGTERIAELGRDVVPKGTMITRLDADTVDGQILNLTRQRQGHLIIGTSAVFRAVGERSVDRVVYLFPERGLMYPDFRSEERTLTLLVRLQQRLKKKHPVVIVTGRSKLIATTITQPLRAWYDKQLQERRRFGYPPFNDVVVLTVRSKQMDTAVRKASRLRETIEQRLGPESVIRGPYTAFVKQRRGQAEVHLLLLGKLDTLVPLYAGLPVEFVDVAPARIL